MGGKALSIIPSSQIPPLKIKFGIVNKSCPRSASWVPVHSLALTIEPVPEWGSQTIPQIYNELFFIMWDNLFFKITKWGDYFFFPERWKEYRSNYRKLSSCHSVRFKREMKVKFWQASRIQSELFNFPLKRSQLLWLFLWLFDILQWHTLLS